MESVKIKLVIAYDGTDYLGWQVQKVGVGIQEKLKRQSASIFPEALAGCTAQAE